MNDEWDVKRVADLVVGDEVRDYGTVNVIDETVAMRMTRLRFDPINGWQYWPSHARVDVRRPVEITVVRAPSFGWWVYVGGIARSSFPCEEHAEWYADMLRGSADERRKALGQ